MSYNAFNSTLKKIMNTEQAESIIASNEAIIVPVGNLTEDAKKTVEISLHALGIRNLKKLGLPDYVKVEVTVLRYYTEKEDCAYMSSKDNEEHDAPSSTMQVKVLSIFHPGGYVEVSFKKEAAIIAKAIIIKRAQKNFFHGKALCEFCQIRKNLGSS